METTIEAGCFPSFTVLQQTVWKKLWNYRYWSLVLQNSFCTCPNALLRSVWAAQQVDSSTAPTEPGVGRWLELLAAVCMRLVSPMSQIVLLPCLAQWCEQQIIISSKPYYYFMHTKANSIINSSAVTCSEAWHNSELAASRGNANVRAREATTQECAWSVFGFNVCVGGGEVMGRNTVCFWGVKVFFKHMALRVVCVGSSE